MNVKSKIIQIILISLLIFGIGSCKHQPKGKEFQTEKLENIKVIDTKNFKKNILETQKKVFYFNNKYELLSDDILGVINLPNITLNSKLTIIDTIEKNNIKEIKGYWLKTKEYNNKVWSGNLSPFKFPIITDGEKLKCTDETPEPIDCLHFYFKDFLNWENGNQFVESIIYDEETLSFKKGYRINKQEISFYNSLQLIKYIYNISKDKDDLLYNYVYNKDVKVWYVLNKKEKDNKDYFFKVIDLATDNYINIIVNYNEPSIVIDKRKYFANFTKKITTLIEKKDYKGVEWKWEMDLD